MSTMTIDYAATENDVEEPFVTAARLELGLRPSFYSSMPGRSEHPDRRPCPAWCTQSDSEYGHEVEAENPLVATHMNDGYPIVASRYTGLRDWDEDRRSTIIHTATIEPRLEQKGSQPPEVRVALRHYPDRKHQEYVDEVLLLGVDDAEELARVLNHLVALADNGAD